MHDQRSAFRAALALMIALAVLAGCTPAQQVPQSGQTGAQPEATEAAPTAQSPGEASESAPAAEPSSPDVFPKAEAKDTTKLVVKDVKVGTGPEAKPGQEVLVHYTGWLVNGSKFDSSRDSGQPFAFPLGAGKVIKGWDTGVAGMKVGGKRILVVPPDQGYGPQGYPPVIPGNATLVFTVELLGVR